MRRVLLRRGRRRLLDRRPALRPQLHPAAEVEPLPHGRLREPVAQLRRVRRPRHARVGLEGRALPLRHHVCRVQLWRVLLQVRLLRQHRGVLRGQRQWDGDAGRYLWARLRRHDLYSPVWELL